MEYALPVCGKAANGWAVAPAGQAEKGYVIRYPYAPSSSLPLSKSFP